MNKEQYKKYLQSNHWRVIRAWVKYKRKYCEICNSKYRLEVHHKNYDHIWHENEHPDDLMLLCDFCHDACHNMKNRNLLYLIANIVKRKRIKNEQKQVRKYRILA